MNNSFSEFHLRTSISIGAGARSLLPQMIQGLGGKRVILFTDKGLVQAGIAAQIISSFPSSYAGGYIRENKAKFRCRMGSN
ncbi:alcohol dehydrogenase class IV [Neobacillus niacini]|nr:alcohol dehydrogenase class IV [Neobacillus niacini]